MKTLVKLAAFTFVFVLGVSEATAQKWGKKVKGNGNITTRTVNTSNYDGLKLVGSMDVHLERGAEGTITVTTDENIQDLIIVEVKDNALIIRSKKNSSFYTKKGVHIKVPFQDLSEVSLVGSGDIDTKDSINSDSFEVNLTGSGDIVLALDSGTVDAKISGSGDMDLSGKATSLEVKLSGSGDFDGGSLKSKNTQAYLSGSGDIIVNAADSLKARVNGSGDIEYIGSPGSSDTKVIGSGSISAN